ncbi:hypothetical protein K8R32_02715, partial [bacterium]|nr:hypothetical protein [bacterium]
KFSVKGLIKKSGEGQLLMGREGTPYIKGSGDTKVRVNPWYFSADSSVYDALNEKAGEYVVLEYIQSRVANKFAQDTDYTVKAVYSVTRKDPEPVSYEIGKDSGSKGGGFRVGRIVKVSKKGHAVKTYEMMMQVGNAGNQFKNMSINDISMYDYAIKVLQSGKKVKIHYNESHIRMPGTRDSNYQVWKIEIPQDI